MDIKTNDKQNNEKFIQFVEYIFFNITLEILTQIKQ